MFNSHPIYLLMALYKYFTNFAIHSSLLTPLPPTHPIEAKTRKNRVVEKERHYHSSIIIPPNQIGTVDPRSAVQVTSTRVNLLSPNRITDAMLYVLFRSVCKF